MSEKTVSVMEQAEVDYRPKEASLKNGEGSGYKPKDSLFTKKKTFLTKNKQEKAIIANWLNIAVNRTQITLFKGSEISKLVFANFDAEAREYYLERIREPKK